MSSVRYLGCYDTEPATLCSVLRSAEKGRLAVQAGRTSSLAHSASHYSVRLQWNI